MPNIRPERKPLFETGFRLGDDRGNPLNLLNRLQPTKLKKPINGIYRTDLPEITKDTKVDMTGRDGLSILVSIPTPGEVASRVLAPFRDFGESKNPPGFTPPEAYFIRGTASLDRESGMATEVGRLLINPASNINKISRTDLAPSVNKWGVRSVLLKFTPGTVNGNQNVYGDANISSDPSYGGWVNPLHYVTNPESINDKTKLPDELGDFPYNYKGDWGAAAFNNNVLQLVKTTPMQKVKGTREDGVPSKYEAFEDYKAAKTFETVGLGGFEQYDFVHNMDRMFHDDNGRISSEQYLASFVDLTTNLEKYGNEDPVMFGFDIIIDWDSSPMFNGAIPDFLEKKSKVGTTTTNPELESRIDLYQSFMDQFEKFFKMNRSTRDPKARPLIKAYYIKKIAGLDFLVEGSVTNTTDTVKSMVDYGKDLIKLTLYEDVTVNTGYLGVLYKTLSWSRLNGKQLIPENLLKFDCKIVVSEIRNYKRLIKKESDPDNPNSSVRWEEYVDNVNKYIYRLYDCQFQFDKLSHGDTLDLSNIQRQEDYEIAFSFKYSNLKFERFDPKQYVISGQPRIDVKIVDNLNVDPTDWYSRVKNSPDTPGSSTVFNAAPRPDGGVNLVGGLTGSSADNIVPSNMTPTDVYPDEINNAETMEQMKGDKLSALSESIVRRLDSMGLGQLKLKDKYRQTEDKWKKYKDSVETTFDKAKRQDLNKRLRQELVKKLKRAAVREANRRITDQARLLNRTLDNIRNSIGLGRMSAPTNVYEGDFLQNDVRNAFREFIGQSVKGFFTP